MAEKRFVTGDNCYGYYTDVIDNDKKLDLSLHNPKKNLTIGELVDLLNELYEENIQLKLRVRMLEQVKPIKEIPRSIEVRFRCGNNGKGN